MKIFLVFFIVITLVGCSSPNDECTYIKKLIQDESFREKVSDWASENFSEKIIKPGTSEYGSGISIYKYKGNLVGFPPEGIANADVMLFTDSSLTLDDGFGVEAVYVGSRSIFRALFGLESKAGVLVILDGDYSNFSTKVHVAMHYDEVGAFCQSR